MLDSQLLVLNHHEVKTTTHAALKDWNGQDWPCLTDGFGTSLRSAMPARNVDSKWFLSLAKASHGSLRKLAEKMVLSNGKASEIGRLSNIINGKGEPAIIEAIQLAELLGQELHEVLRRFGYKLPRSKG